MRLDHLLSKEEIVRVGLLLSRHSVNGDNRIRKFDRTKLELRKLALVKLRRTTFALNSW